MEKKRLRSGEEVPINDYDFTSPFITTAKQFEMELS